LFLHVSIADKKWGTPQPIIVRNPGMGLGVALLTRLWYLQLSGCRCAAVCHTNCGCPRAFTGLQILKIGCEQCCCPNYLIYWVKPQRVLVWWKLIGLTEELGAGVRAKAQDDFAAIGLTLKSFYIGNLKPSDKSAEELRAMGMLDMQTYTQLQAADALARCCSKSGSGGAGLTAGIGAGMGIGNVSVSISLGYDWTRRRSCSTAYCRAREWRSSFHYDTSRSSQCNACF
jgi:hypothetical protein